MNEKVKNPLFQLIIKIWTAHLLSIVLYMFILLIFVTFLGDIPSIILASVVIPIMYLVMSYIDSWRVGNRDRNMVKLGRVEYDKLRSIKAVVFSQLPGIICGILNILGLRAGIVTGFERLFFMSFAYEIQCFGDSFPPVYILPALLPILSVVPGYAMGYADKRLVNYILYTKKDSDD